MVWVTLLLETRESMRYQSPWCCGALPPSVNRFVALPPPVRKALWLSVRYLEKCEASPRAA